MFKKHILKIILLTGLLFNPSAAETYTTHTTENPIIIDGKDDDWNDTIIDYFEDLDGVAGFINDDSTLIIMFRFSDPELQRKISIGGSTLWWHPEGKKKKVFAIDFPAAFTPRPYPEMSDLQGSGARSMELKPGILEMISPVFWDKPKDRKYSWSEIKGIAAASAMVNGMICYEFRIPLNNKNTYALKIKPGKKFKLGLELGGVENKEELRKQMESERPRGMSGRGRGGGMGPPGGTGGGRGGMRDGGKRGGRQSMNDIFKPELFWMTVTLNPLQ